MNAFVCFFVSFVRIWLRGRGGGVVREWIMRNGVNMARMYVRMNFDSLFEISCLSSLCYLLTLSPQKKDLPCLYIRETVNQSVLFTQTIGYRGFPWIIRSSCVTPIFGYSLSTICIFSILDLIFLFFNQTEMFVELIDEDGIVSIVSFISTKKYSKRLCFYSFEMRVSNTT